MEHAPRQGLESGKTYPNQGLFSLPILITLERAPGPQNMAAGLLPVAQALSAGAGKGGSIQGAWQMLGMQAHSAGGKGSWDKVYQRTSLSIGTTRQMRTSGRWGEEKLQIKLGEAGQKPSCPAGSQAWERR